MRKWLHDFDDFSLQNAKKSQLKNLSFRILLSESGRCRSLALNSRSELLAASLVPNMGGCYEHHTLLPELR
jgi:hypothetical protein